VAEKKLPARGYDLCQEALDVCLQVCGRRARPQALLQGNQASSDFEAVCP
jgi:hypothetical protein